MIKKVNVIPHVPVYGIEKPIIDPTMGVELWCGDIKHCILCGAEVYEILKDGELLRLDMVNFNIDNEEVTTPPTEPEVPPTEEPSKEEVKIVDVQKHVIEPTPKKEVTEEDVTEEEVTRQENNKKKNKR